MFPLGTAAYYSSYNHDYASNIDFSLSLSLCCLAADTHIVDVE